MTRNRGGIARNVRCIGQGLVLLFLGTFFVFSTQAASELSAREIAQKIRPSIVQIAVEMEVYRRLWFNDEWSASGSGFIFREDEDGNYWVLTNSHVLGFDNIVAEHKQAPRLANYRISIRVFDDSEAEIVRVLEHESLDAAILVVKAEDANRQSVNIPTEAVEVGGRVYAMGYALGGPLYFTRGIASMVDEQKGEIATDAAISPSNTGGPLVNDRGQVVGMSTYRSNGSEGMGFAIKIEPLLDLQKYLEVNVSDLTAVEQHLISRFAEP